MNAGSGRKEGSEIMKSSIGFKHPKYNANPNKSDLHYDIALFKLNKRFGSQHRSDDDIHYNINTICLPQMNRTNKKAEFATAFGYGLVDNNREVDELQSATFAIYPDVMCPGLICAPFDDDINEARICQVSIKLSIL